MHGIYSVIEKSSAILLIRFTVSIAHFELKAQRCLVMFRSRTNTLWHLLAKERPHFKPVLSEQFPKKKKGLQRKADSVPVSPGYTGSHVERVGGLGGDLQ